MPRARMVRAREVWEQRTNVAIVRVLDNGIAQYIEIEYSYNVYPDNRTTYPIRFEGTLTFDLPERVTNELREAVTAAFDWRDTQGERVK